MYRNDDDKVYVLPGNRGMVIVGQATDRQVLADYIIRNMELNFFRNGVQTTTSGMAHWVRNHVAESVRRAPYQAMTLLGGVFDRPELFLIDEYGALVSEHYAVHGTGSLFSLALLDEKWHEGMELDEAVALLRTCIANVAKRLIVNAPVYHIKAFYKDRVEVVDPK